MDQLIQKLKEMQANYQPNETLRSQLADKTLVMVVGPSAVGKDYCIDQLVGKKPDHSKVRTFITREAREDDNLDQVELLPYDTASLQHIIDEATAGNLVNLAVHPSSSRIYGTRASSFPSKINYLPTLYSATTALDAAGFGSVRVFGVLSEPEEWMSRFNTRHTDEASRNKRLQEAIDSLHWLENNLSRVNFIYNQNGRAHQQLEPEEEITAIIKKMQKIVQSSI